MFSKSHHRVRFKLFFIFIFETNRLPDKCIEIRSSPCAVKLFALTISRKSHRKTATFLSKNIEHNNNSMGILKSNYKVENF